MISWLTSGDGIDALHAEEVVTPQPSATGVLVRTDAHSLNYRDLLVVEGVEGWRPDKPVVPLSDGTGTITHVGDLVDRFQVGDRVLFTFLPRWVKGPLTDEEYSLPVGGPVNRGTLSEFLVADQSELVRAPRNLSPAEAATLPVAGVTAWHSLTRAHIERDDWVLIHGTGGVALFAMQLAIAQGARVIVTSSSAEKRKRLLEVGASAVLDHTTEDVAQRTRDITGGRGADVIVETVGGGNLNVSLDAVRVSGRIAFVGLLAGLEAEVSTYKLVTRNVTIHGIETGSRELLEELVEFMETRDIHPIIDSEFPRSDVAEALRYLQSAKHFGKVVLTA